MPAPIRVPGRPEAARTADTFTRRGPQGLALQPQEGRDTP